MGKCYYYGKEKNEIKAFENHNTSNETQKSDEVKRIIIDDNTELVIETIVYKKSPLTLCNS